MFQGKAGSLAFLQKLNLKVPEWKLITHAEFVSWGDPQVFGELKESIEKNLRAEIKTLSKKFIQTVKIPDFALDFIQPGQFYAIRSSASIEDSPENSFAGIFETQLFVQADLQDSIREVWLSLYSDKALEYCQDRKLSWSLLSMDIIIQHMINGEKSGVLFQADPLGKITHQIINCGWGLGQGIVDDITDTDRYVIAQYEVIESHIQSKVRQLTYNELEGRILETGVLESKQRPSILSQAEIEKILTVSEILSTHSKNFLDVEFTFKNNDLYVLQARPITTLAPKRDIIVFDNSNIAENYPGLSLPLTYSALKRGYSANFKNLLNYLGFPEDERRILNNQLEQLVGYWGGQIYYNLNNWYSVYTLLPFGGKKAAAAFDEMVGIQSDSFFKLPDRSLFKKVFITLKVLPRFLSFYFLTKYHHKTYKKEFQSLYNSLRIRSQEAKGSIEILKLLDETDSKFLSLIKVPLFNDFFSSILNKTCRYLIKVINPEHGDGLYNDLLSHREDLESSKAIYSLIELAQVIRSTPDLRNYLEKHLEDRTIVHLLSQEHQFKEFHRKLSYHFDRYGDRSQWEMKIEVPTAREIPETTIKLLLEYSKSNMTRDTQKEKEKNKAEFARNKIRSLWRKKPFISFLFWMTFKKCSESLCFREDARFDRVRIKGLNRGLVLRLGSLMVGKKLITEKEDLFYLTNDEVMDLAQDSFGPGYLKGLIELRKRCLQNQTGLKLPDRIVINDLTSLSKMSQSAQTVQTDYIRGIPCSGGEVETICEVVTDLNLAPSLTGKILIAERTDPAWGYFFVGVKGIIIEKGSMLSHAAIISRELGIPCIINVKSATQIFKSGMKIKMNGDTGEIEILKD